jgi:hypothetical protein
MHDFLHRIIIEVHRESYQVVEFEIIPHYNKPKERKVLKSLRLRALQKTLTSRASPSQFLHLDERELHRPDICRNNWGMWEHISRRHFTHRPIWSLERAVQRFDAKEHGTILTRVNEAVLRENVCRGPLLGSGSDFAGHRLAFAVFHFNGPYEDDGKKIRLDFPSGHAKDVP